MSVVVADALQLSALSASRVGVCRCFTEHVQCAPRRHIICGPVVCVLGHSAQLSRDGGSVWLQRFPGRVLGSPRIHAPCTSSWWVWRLRGSLVGAGGSRVCAGSPLCWLPHGAEIYPEWSSWSSCNPGGRQLVDSGSPEFPWVVGEAL